MKYHSPSIGKYVFDSLTIGMYSHPLMLYREYIQNSVDAIDAYSERGYSPSISINVDGFDRVITIRDNGSGIGKKHAWQTFHNLGCSKKVNGKQRGFRGIGRLGGVAYCEKLIFTTKAKNESIVSINEWDCKELRSLISHRSSNISIKKLIRNVSTFRQEKSKSRISDHYFEVKMVGVKSTQDSILDVPLVKQYIAKTCPVPFNNGAFKYSEQIEKYLKKNVPLYKTYSISVNEENIYKLYTDSVEIGSSRKDPIKGIKFFSLAEGKKTYAHGWLADIQYLGVINKKSGVSGIGVRTGNIMIGDESILEKYFREERFNNYVVGELHTINPHLVANARRDNFEDSAEKEGFLHLFVKEVGLPISKYIRAQSVQRNSSSIQEKVRDIIYEAESIIENGYFSRLQLKRVIEELKKIKKYKLNTYSKDGINKLLKEIPLSSHCIDLKLNSNNKKISIAREIFESIYDQMSNKPHAHPFMKTLSEKLIILARTN